MEQITRQAYAKINLGLDVTGRRPNGYHDVKMIMQTISLHDTLTLKKKSQPGIEMTMEGGNELVPLDDHNLIVKSIRKVCEYCHLNYEKLGLSIHLVKRIPVAAGLAGGSTDAAAAIQGMNELYELSLSNEEMREIGVQIGADVPFCIMGGTALSEGIGEVLTKLPSPKQMLLLLVKPKAAVSTKEVYERLDGLENPVHPDIDALLAAIKTDYSDFDMPLDVNKEGNLGFDALHDANKNGNSDSAIDGCNLAGLLGNILEQVTIPLHPEIAGIKEKLLELGALAAMMSGSGPTVFAIFDSEDKRAHAQEVMDRDDGIEGAFCCELQLSEEK